MGDFTLTEEVLQGSVSTTCVTEDGQNVIIIVAPPSPAHSNIYTSDTDPEWVPSPASSVSPSSPLRTISTESRAVKKKYQRKKPPTPPVGPYPWRRRRGRRRRTGQRPSGIARRRRVSRTPWKRSSNFSLSGTRNLGPS